MKKLISLFVLFSFQMNFTQEKHSTAADNVQIISEKFALPQLNTTRRVWIYLPPDYERTQKKYPVIYLQDGQNLFDDRTSYAGEWQIDETLNSLFSKGDSGSIVVGIDNGGEKRIADLSPFKNDKYGGGNGDLYLDFIVNNLKPYIDHHYRTKSCRKHTTLGGSSLGALISVYGGVKYPKIFGKILAFSPAFWFNSKELNNYIVHSNTPLSKQKYYFIQGQKEDEGMDLETLKVIENLKSKNVKAQNIYFKEDQQGKHNELFWQRVFPVAYEWLHQ